MHWQGNERAQRRRGHAFWTVGTVLVAVLGLGACGKSGDQSNYFPLTPGWSWSYRVSSEIRNVGKDRSHTFVIDHRALTVDGQKVTPRMYQDGHVFYYAAGDDGVLLVADGGVGTQARAAQPDQYVLKYPLDIGTVWPVWSETRLLRRQVFSPNAVNMVPVITPIEITYTIEGKGDVVKVPAGTFLDCIRLRGTGTVVFDMGQPVGEVEIFVDTTEWFAPGVGLVKIIRKEDSRPGSPAAGVMTVELDSLDKGSWFN